MSPARVAFGSATLAGVSLSSRSLVAVLGLGLLVACGDDASSSGGGGSGAATQGGNNEGGAGGSGASSAEGGQGGTSSSGGQNAGGSGGSTPTGEPLFVAVGYGGRRMRSVDGSAWTNDVVVDPNGGDDNTLFRGVGFGDGVFVAVGGSSEGQILTTENGIDWTTRTPASSWLGDVTFEDGVFIAAGGNGLRQRSLDLGATWIDPGPYYAGHFRGIASGGGVVVAAGHTYGGNDQGLIMRSTDLGATWESEIVGGPQFGSIAYGAGRFVAVGQDGCRSSADGAAWSDCGLGGGLGRVVFANAQFIVPEGGGYSLSADGVSWMHLDAPSRGVTTFGEGLYLAIGWPDRIETSADLLSFNVVNQDTGPALTEIAFGHVSP